MGSACFFAVDSIFHCCPNFNPHAPVRFDDNEGRETAPFAIGYLVVGNGYVLFLFLIFMIFLGRMRNIDNDKKWLFVNLTRNSRVRSLGLNIARAGYAIVGRKEYGK